MVDVEVLVSIEVCDKLADVVSSRVMSDLRKLKTFAAFRYERDKPRFIGDNLSVRFYGFRDLNIALCRNDKENKMYVLTMKQFCDFNLSNNEVTHYSATIFEKFH